ncbi:MAG: glutamate synthase, partial [Chloroflexi bacterium]|nr:glutamate synthase [Chloroflexota bacterium]
MGKPTGFIEFPRKGPQRRPVKERLLDWRDVYQPWPEKDAKAQAARCMDCGVPFCNKGCPLGNL